MASAQGIVLGATAISFTNEWIQSSDPLPNFRIPIAGGIFAVLIGGLQSVSPRAAVGIASIMMVTVLFTPVHGNSPAGTLAGLAISKPKGK